jgi:hypothetical protein
MSTQPLTYEGILELFRETRDRIEGIAKRQEKFDHNMEASRLEFDRRMKETDRQMKETDRKIGKLGNRIGEIVEHMVGGNIVTQFQNYGYNVTETSRNIEFGTKATSTEGEIDVLLDDGSVAILISVKTNLKNDDVLAHVKQMENYRKWKDSKGEGKNDISVQ